jgi:hypothetical protein
MKRSLFFCIGMAFAASGITAHAAPETVAGIQLYPGASSSNVEDSEQVIKSSGYPIAVCRHTTDNLDKVVAFYRNDKQLSPMGAPSKDNAGRVDEHQQPVDEHEDVSDDQRHDDLYRQQGCQVAGGAAASQAPEGCITPRILSARPTCHSDA